MGLFIFRHMQIALKILIQVFLFHSVMDVLNMMQNDPEEFLLDLGFGIDEPDLAGRIPARFLSYQSNARGISFQLFLDAQQSRMDIENPDVRSEQPVCRK